MMDVSQSAQWNGPRGMTFFSTPISSIRTTRSSTKSAIQRGAPNSSPGSTAFVYHTFRGEGAAGWGLLLRGGLTPRPFRCKDRGETLPPGFEFQLPAQFTLRFAI